MPRIICTAVTFNGQHFLLTELKTCVAVIAFWALYHGQGDRLQQLQFRKKVCDHLRDRALLEVQLAGSVGAISILSRARQTPSYRLLINRIDKNSQTKSDSFRFLYTCAVIKLCRGLQESLISEFIADFIWIKCIAINCDHAITRHNHLYFATHWQRTVTFICCALCHDHWIVGASQWAYKRGGRCYR